MDINKYLYFFRLRIKIQPLYPHVDIYGQRLHEPEFLDPRPHTEENKETRKNPMTKKKED
jgi:hypothetical protein